MQVEAEVSLYPLGEPHLSRPIQAFVKVLEDHRCQATVGEMSTIVKGDSADVFEALRAGYGQDCHAAGVGWTLRLDDTEIKTPPGDEQ